MTPSPKTPAICPICKTNPSDSREHVWPKWFLDRMDAVAPPPFGWSINGTPILNRNGLQIKSPRRQRVFLNVCEQCNRTMNREIEMPVQGVVDVLAQNGWSGSHSRDEWKAIGIWWAKVLLMIGHPESRLENRRLDAAVRLKFQSAPDLTWLTSGSGPPKDVSVFVHHTDLSQQATDYTLVVPATVLFPGGDSKDCHVLTLSTPGLAVAVVCHPGLGIENPMVSAGDAWELIHQPPLVGDLASLKLASPKAVAYVRGGPSSAGVTVDSSPASQLQGLFDSTDVEWGE